MGIGGGIPSLHKGPDIRLGDVVISQPDKTFGGGVRYDLRKKLVEERFERKGRLKDMVKKHPNLVKNGYGFPGREHDSLYCRQCGGSNSSGPCHSCTDGKIERPARDDQHPAFWYGVIASGNELMKNATERDRTGQEFGAQCVEMEAAGLMKDFPCMVIRGICEYADSYKNDEWQ
jgi:hypothetical protein